VLEKKLDALGVIVSQFYEGGANGSAELVPSKTDFAKQKERHQQVRDSFTRRFQADTDRFRAEVTEWYGKDRAQKIKCVEPFEICEYGSQPSKQELKRLFPFFGE
jgi:hypothetical protein